MDDTKRQTLIERFDTKISTHINAIVAITFGAFTVLTFLRGQGFPPRNLVVWYLLAIEIFVFPLGVFYCLCRGFYYSRAAEKIKDNNLAAMEKAAGEEALEEMPPGVKEFVGFRLKIHPPEIAKIIVPIAWLLWIGVISVVLTL